MYSLLVVSLVGGKHVPTEHFVWLQYYISTSKLQKIFGNLTAVGTKLVKSGEGLVKFLLDLCEWTRDAHADFQSVTELFSLYKYEKNGKCLKMCRNEMKDNMLTHIIKPSLLFVGHMQTVHTQIKCHRMRLLISFSTVCLQYVPFKLIDKLKNTPQQPLKQKWTGPIDKMG